MKPILEIRGVSKQYKLGGKRIRKTETFRELLHRAASAPFRAMAGRDNGTSQMEQILPFWALKDVNLDINQGDVIGIIGRNGAGKSTLLKILSRITSPTEGQVVLRGRLASLLEVGTGFHPELTGRENIFLNGAILGMRKAEIDRRFDEIVAFSEIEKFLDTPVKHYSSGMYVRPRAASSFKSRRMFVSWSASPRLTAYSRVRADSYPKISMQINPTAEAAR